MTTYKTTSGLLKATSDLASALRSSPITEQHDYESASRKVDNLRRQLNALWSNPADAADCDKACADLIDAWNQSTGATA